MSDATAYLLQRLTAAILAPLVLIHMVVILFAIGDGLTAAEILARTKGNWVWFAFYTLFVLSTAIHAPLGIRNILREWLKLHATWVEILSVAFAAVILITGLRAVWAVT